jgi:hypothetical protein
MECLIAVQCVSDIHTAAVNIEHRRTRAQIRLALAPLSSYGRHWYNTLFSCFCFCFSILFSWFGNNFFFFIVYILFIVSLCSR